MLFKHSSRLKERGGLYHGFECEQRFVNKISVRGGHAHAVIHTTRSTFELNMPTEMLTRTQTNTHTHTQMRKLTNVTHIAKGIAKKRKKNREGLS